MGKIILGISGLAGTGKDTSADFLVKNHDFVKLSLADPIKRICRDVFDFSDQQLWGPSAERNKPDHRHPREHTWHDGVCVCCGAHLPVPKIVDHWGHIERDAPAQCYLTPRYALQTLGTEWGRNCHENVWVDYALRLAKNLLTEKYSYTQQQGILAGTTQYNGVVIADARFRNEIDAIHESGGFVVRIKRPNAGLTGGAALHASESEQLSIPDSLFDYIIDNSSDLAALENIVSKMFYKLKNSKH